MVYIKFLNDLEPHEGNVVKKSAHVISLSLTTPINASGFRTYRDYQMKELMGDFTDYTTVYDAETFSLSNDGSTKPTPTPTPTPTPPTEMTATFTYSGIGSLDGDLVQVVDLGADMDVLDIPTPIEINDRYEFTGWIPPIEGAVESDVTFTAIFELKQEYTVEGRLTSVENTVNNLLGVNE